MHAGAARAEPERVPLDAQRVGELERLGRRRERVRHRDVHARRAVGVRARALAAADRLVVGEAVVAEDDVVHRPLALRRHRHGLPEGAEEQVDDPARRLDVPGGDRGGRAGVDEAALRRAHGHRDERPADAGTSGSVRARTTNRQAERRHRERAVEVAVVLRRRAGEVELELVAGDRDRDAELELAVGRLEHLGRLVAAVRERGDPGPDAPLRVGDELVHRRGHLVAAAAGAELGDPAGAEPLRRQLRAQVAAPLVRVPHLRDERVSVASSRRVGGITTPSSASVRESAGMLPGTRRRRRRGAPASRRSRAPCARRA